MKKIAVKELAYFVCQSGDLTPEFFSNRDLEAGTKAHDFLQSKYSEDDLAEVYIKKELTFNGESYLLHGFIDGVLTEDFETVIEEIKSTTKDLDEITEIYHKEHLAQAKIYAYLYALQNNMDSIRVRITYISIIDYDTKSFDSILTIDDLEDFTFSVLEEYISWLNMLDEAAVLKEKTIKTIEFPFKEMRQGQRKLMNATYKALKDEEILYAIAPTGIGKTMATMFSALKTLGKNDKLFYATAKGSGKTAPVDAIKLLTSKGLKLKTIDLTAKAKICNKKCAHCNPDDCQFAIGFFDRLKKATLDIFENYDVYDSQCILDVANKHNICAFEFSLYLSYYCDLVICDYNYVFDPHAHLIRYFEDDTYKPKVLVDEAHNLISRSKEMYSAYISEEDIRALRKLMSPYKPSMRKSCNKAIEAFEPYREKMAEKALYVDTMADNNLYSTLKSVSNDIDVVLEQNKKVDKRDEILDISFKILDFLRVSEYFSETHRLIAKLEDDMVSIGYYCLDASKFLLDTIKTSIHGIVFFSATLYPIEYHCNLLTAGEGKYLELESPFPQENLDIIINNSISTRYKNRNSSVDDIVETIETLVSSKQGNYIVFFPSYQYLNQVVDHLELDCEIIIQKQSMNDLERLEVIDRFKNTTNTKVGLFVMGGVFSEGIDFIGDYLSGVIVVGVGLPMVCDENNILKDYFELTYEKGFDYAYVYPGFTKVIQAVGRVIRSDTDRGVVILMDERFTYANYLSLMPPHWTNKKVITNNYTLKKELSLFYKK